MQYTHNAMQGILLHPGTFCSRSMKAAVACSMRAQTDYAVASRNVITMYSFPIQAVHATVGLLCFGS